MELTVIQQRIFELRGVKVILDRDLAELYGVETRVLNQAVRRNAERFPADFAFQLTADEMENWKSQIVISNSVKMGLRKCPIAFTEQGVAMMSSVLKSPVAIQINVSIMRAFVAIRQGLSLPGNDEIATLKQRISELELAGEETLAALNDLSEDTRHELDGIYQVLTALAQDKPKRDLNPIGYNAIIERRKKGEA